MIPYPDLVAALERWRLRNGLPVGGGGVPSMSMGAPASAPVMSYVPPAPMPARPSAPMGSVAAPIAPKVPERAQTDEPLDLHDDDVLDEDMLAPEGGDFAMAFGVSSAKPVEPPSYGDDDVPEERTAIGLPDPHAPNTSPFPTETQPGFDTLDADGDVFDESDDPDPRRRP